MLSPEVRRETAPVADADVALGTEHQLRVCPVAAQVIAEVLRAGDAHAATLYYTPVI